MPSITLAHTAQGPLLTVGIMPSSPRQKALLAAGAQIPTPTSGVFLVDTGASSTVVDAALIAPLGLTPTGNALCHTPSTGKKAVSFNQYDVMLIIPGTSPGQTWLIEALPIMECDLSAQGIKGLIGRDVLDRAILIYNGPTKHFSIAY